MCFPAPPRGRPPILKRRPPCQQSPHIRATFPICWRRSSIRFHGSPIQSPSSKNPDIDFDETSVRLRKSPTNPDQQTPWTCVTPQQTKRQPVQANHLTCVTGGLQSNQAAVPVPANRTCHATWAGGWSPPRAYSRPCSWARCTAMRTSLHGTSSAETSVRLRFERIYTSNVQLTQIPCGCEGDTSADHGVQLA